MRNERERVVTSIASDLLGSGAIVTWEATHFGARIRLMSQITQFDAPRSFEDEQIADRAPYGLLGMLAESVFLDRYLRALLQRRAAYLRALAESRP